MAKPRPTEFKIAFGKITWRLLLLTVICLAMWGAAHLPQLPVIRMGLRGHTDVGKRAVERIGSPAIVYDVRAYGILECDDPERCKGLSDDTLDYDVRIEVLDSGLI